MHSKRVKIIYKSCVFLCLGKKKIQLKENTEVQIYSK